MQGMGIFVDDQLVHAKVRDLRTEHALATEDDDMLTMSIRGDMRYMTLKGKLKETENTNRDTSAEDYDLKVRLLSEVPFFSDMPNALSTVASMAIMTEFFIDEYLCIQGEMSESMLVVFDGTVAVFKTGLVRRTLDAKTEPIILGEKAMFDDLPRGANVQVARLACALPPTRPGSRAAATRSCSEAMHSSCAR